MIHSFSCKNFYSFNELTTVEFIVNDKAPHNSGYFEAGSGARLSRIETIIGPNASGKTNLLKVLPFLKWMIIDSFNAAPGAPIPVKPFVLGGIDKPTELSVDFEVGGNVYIYNFVLTEQRIISEELLVKSKTVKKTTSKRVFLRTWNEKTNAYDLSDVSFDLPRDFAGLLRANASVISAAMRLNHVASLQIANYWQLLQSNVREAGWDGDHFFNNQQNNLFAALDYFSGNAELKQKVEQLLGRFDLGLHSFDIKKEKQENGVTMNISVAHSFGGQMVNLPLNYESSGTKQLFILSRAILDALATGGFVVIDELDASLHPDMVSALLELFTDADSNEKNAQILFSTHSHRILNTLDKYQIVLVEKGENGQSEAWRLDDVAGIRADDNYYTKYVAGAYGAIPKL